MCNQKCLERKAKKTIWFWYECYPLMRYQCEGLWNDHECMYLCNSNAEFQEQNTRFAGNQYETVHSYSNILLDYSNNATWPANGIWTKRKWWTPIALVRCCALKSVREIVRCYFSFLISNITRRWLRIQMARFLLVFYMALPILRLKLRVNSYKR